MSWREELQPASFRDVPFHVDASTTTQGRHVDEQLFPGRDDPGSAVHVEPLGMGPRRFTIEAFVVGADVFERRDALERALLEPGPGRLVHPHRGERLVSVIPPIRTVESRKRGGYARISFTVVEEDTPRLRRTPDTTAIVERDLDAYLDALAADFGEQYDTDEVPAAYQASSQDAFSAAVGGLSAAYAQLSSGIGVASDFATDLGGYVDDLDAFVSAPFGAARALIGALGTIAQLPLRVVQAGASLPAQGGGVVGAVLTAMRPFVAFGEAYPLVPETTTNRRSEARLRGAVVQLVRGAAIGATASTIAHLPFDSRTAALAVRSELVDAFDALVDEGSAGGATVSGADLYDAIARARASVVSHLTRIARSLPDVQQHTVARELPLLVIAHQLYGDATRADDLLARNRIPDPGLVPAGTVLEVLGG